MKRYVLLGLFLSVLGISGFTAQENSRSYLYKGTIDGKLPVTMFVVAEDIGCGHDPVCYGMYKYDKVSNWLQVYIHHNDKEEYVMVENDFTGVLILKREGENLNGIWISPDTKRQLKVIFEKIPLTKKQTEDYKETYDQLNYSNNDC